MQKNTLIPILLWIWIIILGTIIFGLLVGDNQLENTLFTTLWVLLAIYTIVVLIVGFPWLKERFKRGG